MEIDISMEMWLRRLNRMPRCIAGCVSCEPLSAASWLSKDAIDRLLTLSQDVGMHSVLQLCCTRAQRLRGFIFVFLLSLIPCVVTYSPLGSMDLSALASAAPA
jgi:hypothetical protein